jgi:hypothetical protein
MSRPRFLADHDLNERIVQGVLRQEPLVDVHRARDLGLQEKPDAEILHYAAEHGLIVISHDVNTMTEATIRRIHEGLHVPGVLLAPQAAAIGDVIDSLVLIWTASEAEEDVNLVDYLPL